MASVSVEELKDGGCASFLPSPHTAGLFFQLFILYACSLTGAALKDTLDKSGALRQLKAKLRADIFGLLGADEVGPAAGSRRSRR